MAVASLLQFHLVICGVIDLTFAVLPELKFQSEAVAALAQLVCAVWTLEVVFCRMFHNTDESCSTFVYDIAILGGITARKFTGVRHLLSIPTSRVAYAIWPPMLLLTTIAAVTTGYNEAVMAHALPPWMPLLHLSTLPLSFTAPCLSLLLVFRTNSSYTRFDEARKAWATMLCRTRDMVRQALTWMRHPADVQRLQRFLSYAAAFPYTLKSILVEDADVRSELAPLLEPPDVDAMLAAPHSCNYALQVNSETVHHSGMREMEKSMMDMNITQLHDILGQCERIFGTPLLLSYTRLTSRFLIIWHIILPNSLWDSCNWIAVPATFTSASALFCIDGVGVLIEEPFPLLALPDICDDIRKSIAGLVAARDLCHVQASSDSAPSEKP